MSSKKVYKQCDADTMKMIRSVLQHTHDDLKKAKASVQAAFVENDDPDDHEPALSLHGWPALATVRVTKLRERVMGFKDIEILIAADSWEGMSDRQRRALIDHELEHVVVRHEKLGGVKRDSEMRPVLKLRQHDWELGGFTSIAERWGEDAPEVRAARAIAQKHGELLFGFMHDTEAAA